MDTLDPALPGFVKSCVELHQALLPAGMALLMVGFAVEFWHGPPAPVELLKFLVKVFLIVLLMARSFAWINQSQVRVNAFIEQHVPANAVKVAERFKEKLAEAQNATGQKDQSFWDTLFSSNWFDALILAGLTLVSWLAMALQFFIYTVQRACLLVFWCLSVLLFPTLAIRPLSHLGMRHLLRIVATLMWPLSFALAATITSGLLDVATDKDFLGSSGYAGALGRSMISCLCLMVIAVWVAFSTIAGPIMIQRLIAGSSGPAGVLSKSADLVTNIGLPSGFGVPAAARYAGRAGRGILERGAQAWGSIRRAPRSRAEARTRPPESIPAPRPPAPGPTPKAPQTTGTPVPDTANAATAVPSPNSTTTDSTPPTTSTTAASSTAGKREWSAGADDPTGDKKARTFARQIQRGQPREFARQIKRN